MHLLQQFFLETVKEDDNKVRTHFLEDTVPEENCPKFGLCSRSSVLADNLITVLLLFQGDLILSQILLKTAV